MVSHGASIEQSDKVILQAVRITVFHQLIVPLVGEFTQGHDPGPLIVSDQEVGRVQFHGIELLHGMKDIEFIGIVDTTDTIRTTTTHTHIMVHGTGTGTGIGLIFTGIGQDHIGIPDGHGTMVDGVGGTDITRMGVMVTGTAVTNLIMGGGETITVGHVKVNANGIEIFEDMKSGKSGLM